MKTISVEEEYEKNTDLKSEDVKDLLNWAKLQPHLPEISELEIILFLQSCYFQSDAAKLTIENYYTSRTNFTDLFDNRDPQNELVQKASDMAVYQPLPGVTPEGYKVIYMKILDDNVSKFNFAQQLKICEMSIDLWLAQDGTAPGHIILMDMRGIVLWHLTKLNLLTLKNFFFYLQECLPVRLKGLHFYEAVSFIDKILMIFKPFMKKELLDVLHVHTSANVSNIYNFVPKVMLPEDCGGKGPTIQQLNDKMKQNFNENREYFLEMDKNQRVNEKKRVTNTAKSE